MSDVQDEKGPKEKRELPAYVRAARSQPCPNCGAGIGDPCRASSGRATTNHAARSRITRAAQNIGYEEGLRDALLLLDWQVKTHGVNATPEQIREQIERQREMVARSNDRREAASDG